MNTKNKIVQELDVKGMVLKKRTNKFMITGCKGAYAIHVNFDSVWDGLSKTAYFYNDNTPLGVVLDNDNDCAIPQAIANVAGKFSVLIVGKDSNENVVCRTNAVYYSIASGAWE